MKSPDTTYTNPHEHLSQDQLIRYQQDMMDDAEMHQVERHLLECELCSDAVEGMELLEAKDAESALKDLKGRLSTRLGLEEDSSKPLYWKWGIAASILLLAGTVFFLWNKSQFNIQEQKGREVIQPEPREEAPYYSFHEDKGPEDKEGEQSVESEPVPVPGAGREVEDRNSVSQSQEKKVAPQPLIEAEMDEEAFEAEAPEAGEVQLEEERHDSVIEEIRFKPENSLAESTSDRNAQVVPGVSMDPPSLAKSAESSAAESVAYVRSKAIAPGRMVQNGMGSVGSKLLKGKVTDSSGEPLPGVNVRLAGSNKGTITDLDGEYTIHLPEEDTILNISFIGFETQEIPVEARDTQLLAVLEEDVKSLSEVVVVGYGAERRREVTGAVSTVPEIKLPQPTEGMRSLKQYLKQHQRYTSEAREAKVEGTVVVEFFVEPDSTLSDFRIRKSLGYGLDEEAIRLLQEGPSWRPATSGEEVIRHKVKVRVPFRLD